MRAVTNAGPLIHLSWIDRLDLLSSLYDELIAPVAVRDEVLSASEDIPGVAAIRAGLQRGWPTIRAVTDVASVRALRASLDAGEAEALVLAREVDADMVLLDDRRARSFALREGLPITGTLGILRRAREAGLIAAASPLLPALLAQGFRISEELVAQVVREESTTQQ